MKTGILTLPLTTNYGGLLQNYALQQVLSDLGHEAVTINLPPKKFDRPFIMLASIAKRMILRMLGRKVWVKIWSTSKEKKQIAVYTQAFITNYIKTTDLFTGKPNKNKLKSYQLEAYIVGSDQVWRPRYTPHIYTYFLDFLSKNSVEKKIAYAASFGVDNREFSAIQTKIAKKLLHRFNAVSVREESGVSLCEQYFDTKAIRVVDPTLLLNKEKYESLVAQSKVKKSGGTLFAYILDKSTEKGKMVADIAFCYNYKVFSVMPQINDFEAGTLDKRVYPPVEKWIRGFMDAEFIITDSYHGTVFSIIFNKPFVVIVNEGRGSTRFKSLLQLFRLENRIVGTLAEIKSGHETPIDWPAINSILEVEKQKSINFLKAYLK